MDYEKVLVEHKFPTYEELKNGLLRLIDEGKISREDAARLLPELRESEDERIRKELIFFLKEEILRCSIKEHAGKLKEFVAYLEKQKEQKQAEWSEEDEAMLDSVIRIITQFDDLAHEPTFAGPKWTHPYTKELNFLNGLRNRLFNKND